MRFHTKFYFNNFDDIVHFDLQLQSNVFPVYFLTVNKTFIFVFINHRMYEKLPEVVRKREEERRQQEYQSNRIKLKQFDKVSFR